MRRFVLSLTLQAGEHSFNMKKLYVADLPESATTAEITESYLSEWDENPTFEGANVAYYDIASYALTITHVKELSDQDYKTLFALLETHIN